MTTFEDAKVGDKVWCIYNGWQTIIKITNFTNTYPIETDKTLYTYEGRMAQNKGRTLFWDEVVITPPEKPLPKLDVDTKVLVWNSEYDIKQKLHFSHFNSSGAICVFPNGTTSWSVHTAIALKFNNWELAKD